MIYCDDHVCHQGYYNGDNDDCAYDDDDDDDDDNYEDDYDDASDDNVDIVDNDNPLPSSPTLLLLFLQAQPGHHVPRIQPACWCVAGDLPPQF